jgi:Domain of unknown function (DUF4349)
MSQPEFDVMLLELRAKAPLAPEGLRERVQALPEPASRGFRRPSLRPALAAAAAIAVAVGVGAAVIGGFDGSRSNESRLGAEISEDRAQSGQSATLSGQSVTKSKRTFGTLLSSTARSPITPGSRLQHYDVSMQARVDDLSDATKRAVRTTRKLGGYLAAANYSTDRSAGDSTLDLRVPVQHVQQAIASFTELGTILSQRIALTDLQANVDRIRERVAELRTRIAKLEAKRRTVGLTLEEQGELAGLKRNVRRLSGSQRTLVRSATYAEVQLLLTTRKPAAKHAAPGRFNRFRDNAGDILGKEAIAVLYALVVAGPFILLAALALLGERARRRRADSRLLEETG